MYELQKNGKVFTSKFVGTGPSSCKKRIYQAAVSQRLRNPAINEPCHHTLHLCSCYSLCTKWVDDWRGIHVSTLEGNRHVEGIEP